MNLKFEVRQQVRSVASSWLVAVYETTVERLARQAFDRFRAEHPEEYFELVQIQSSEDCLAFTPRQQQEDSVQAHEHDKA